MKKYASINEVSFEDILQVLQEWETGTHPYEEIQGWAEEIVFSGWHKYEKKDPRSILAYIVRLLEHMYTEPVLRKDIPLLRQILMQAESSPANAWMKLNRFVQNTDWNHRWLQARDNIHQHHNPLLDTISDL